MTMDEKKLAAAASLVFKALTGGHCDPRVEKLFGEGYPLTVLRAMMDGQALKPKEEGKE
jgi:hypothetical protein